MRFSTGRAHVLDPLPAKATPASSLCHLEPRFVLRVVQRAGARFVVACPLQATAARQALLLPHRNRGSCTTELHYSCYCAGFAVTPRDHRPRAMLKVNYRALGLTILTADEPPVPSSGWQSRMLGGRTVDLSGWVELGLARGSAEDSGGLGNQSSKDQSQGFHQLAANGVLPAEQAYCWASCERLNVTWHYRRSRRADGSMHRRS